MSKDEATKQLTALEIIKSRVHELSAKKITLGFDAFIDSVVKVVKYKNEQSSTSYFESPHSFGEYIAAKAGKNLSIELEELTTKLGGNMPIMANAIAHLGPQVSCIGPLGHPDIHPVFRNMPPNCHLLSFGNPGLTKVLEFNSGKIMMAEMGILNKIEWSFIKEKIGTKTLIDLFTTSDVVSILNWSELDNSTAIWKGLLADILPKSVSTKRPLGFFDLSDCSKRGDAAIREAMQLLNAFSSYWDVMLSLNLNEAVILHSVLCQNKQKEEDVEKMCEEISSKLNIQTVIIHSSKQAVAWDGSLHKTKSFFIREPLISSGSGDNFNAGFCIGKLLGLETETSLMVGNAVANLYMRSGISPTASTLVDFLFRNLSSEQLNHYE